MSANYNMHKAHSVPVIVPETTVPFLSSMVTDSLLSFMRNRTSFILSIYRCAMTKYPVWKRS